MPYRTDERFSGRHPFEIFMMILTLLVSLPVVFGITARPGSIAALLPPPAGFVWSVVLATGAALVLSGIYWRNRAKGLIFEQLGLGLVAIACMLYGVAVGATVQKGSSISVAIIIGFGISCAWRYWDIQRILRHVRLEAEALKAVRGE